MTLGTTMTVVTSQGNAATSSFSYPFLIPTAVDASVIYTDPLGNQRTLSITEYEISDVGNEAGGTVTYPLSGPPIPTGSLLTIARGVPVVQTTSVTPQGPTFSSLEGALDYLTMIAQQHQNQLGRAIQLNIADIGPVPQLPPRSVLANQLLGFNSLGEPIPGQPTNAIVSAVMQPVVGASTVSSALQLLSTPVFGDFGVPAFGASTSGPENGIIGQITNNLPPNTPDFPTGVTGYGDMLCSGGYAFGVFGRADLRTNGNAVGAEFDVFNLAGTPTGFLPPNDAFGTTDFCAIALQVAAYGTFPSLLGFAVLLGEQPFQYGIYTHPQACTAYSLFIDADTTDGPANAAALIRSKSTVPNLILQAQGNFMGPNSVLEVIDGVGGVHAQITQQGDFITPGISVGHDGTINYITPATSGTATAGGNVLPSNPLGFLVQKLAGATIKIPYYSA